MRPTPWLLAEPHRVMLPGLESQYGDDYGCFHIPHAKTGVKLRCIVSSGKVGLAEFGEKWAWDHVSVSLPGRCPNWPEMSFIKSVFWADDETAFQLHVPAADHLSLHPYCLHLWRPLALRIPLPPSEMVAAAGGIDENRRRLHDLISGAGRVA